MVYDFFYGEISEKRQKNWNLADEKPYDVLKKNYRIEKTTGWLDILACAKHYLSDEIQVDWGSFAWKTNKENLKKFVYDIHGELEEPRLLQSDGIYGVVFIEVS